MKSTKIQILIIFISIYPCILGIKTILQASSVLFKPWFSALISFSILFFGSLILGFIIKALFKSSWLPITFTSIILTVGSLTYYLFKYKNSYPIYIPDNYTGLVRLYISRDNKNDFLINDYGIGYISYRNYKKGFIPIVIKNGADITDQIVGMGGKIYPASFNQKYIIDYKRFKIPGATVNADYVSFNQLVNQNAIDTSRLRLK